MVASPNPLDQFLAHHPDYFFGKSPEQALINPDHLLILLNHLRCALFELPFQKGEGFGSLPAATVQEVLEYLTSNQEVHLSQDQYFWMSDAYPAANISLRSASPDSVVLQTTDDRPQIIGQVDLASAYWMIHPDAIYLHEGQQYFVHELNLEKKVATLTAVALDYYTEPRRETEIQVLSKSALAKVPGGEKGWGEIQVTTQVVGFKKLRWFTQENLGEAPLDLPPTELQTTGYWITLSNAAVDSLREAARGPTTRTTTAPIGPVFVSLSAPAMGSVAVSAARRKTVGSMTFTTRSRSGRLLPWRKRTAWITSSLSAPPAITRPSRTCAFAQGLPGCPMCSASLRRSS